MAISKGTTERINFLFKSEPETEEKLLNLDPDSIRNLASCGGINPDDFISAYESDDLNAMLQLYYEAKRLSELQKLYKELCFEYCNDIKEATEEIEYSGFQKRII